MELFCYFDLLPNEITYEILSFFVNDFSPLPRADWPGTDRPMLPHRTMVCIRVCVLWSQLLSEERSVFSRMKDKPAFSTYSPMFGAARDAEWGLVKWLKTEGFRWHGARSSMSFLDTCVRKGCPISFLEWTQICPTNAPIVCYSVLVTAIQSHRMDVLEWAKIHYRTGTTRGLLLEAIRSNLSVAELDVLCGLFPDEFNVLGITSVCRHASVDVMDWMNARYSARNSDLFSNWPQMKRNCADSKWKCTPDVLMYISCNSNPERLMNWFITHNVEFSRGEIAATSFAKTSIDLRFTERILRNQDWTIDVNETIELITAIMDRITTNIKRIRTVQMRNALTKEQVDAQARLAFLIAFNEDKLDEFWRNHPEL